VHQLLHQLPYRRRSWRNQQRKKRRFQSWSRAGQSCLVAGDLVDVSFNGKSGDQYTWLTRPLRYSSSLLLPVDISGMSALGAWPATDSSLLTEICTVG
jgi:hypothetical protein